MRIEVGQYWRRLDSLAEDRMPPLGSPVLVTNVAADELQVRCENTTWTFTPEIFLGGFEFVREGAQSRMDEVAQLLREMEQASAAAVEGADDLAAIRTRALGAVGDGSAETGLTKQSAADMKKRVALFRNNVLKMNKVMKEKQEKMERILRETAALWESKMESLQGMVKFAEEAIWTINLYLGRDEKIVRLRKGKPAPAEELIHIRQLTLYMDEECAIAAESGGIDVTTISEFDAWLLANPAHVGQVIPEPRGVVAIKPRRSRKTYEGIDAMTAMQLDRENARTYWLFRNGENLYRVETNLAVDGNIIPHADEFMAIFESREMDWKTRDYVTRTLRPGTVAYADAMEKAGSRQRHYMRILLFLQGVLDRTPIFRPMRTEHVNILDERENASHICYVRDGEPGRLLTDGWGTFTEWQRELNGKLTVGNRIIATFGYHSGNYCRRHPERAEMPDSLTLYNLSHVTSDTVSILYAQARKGYYKSRHNFTTGKHLDGGWRAPSKRATCHISRRSPHYLNFDAASVEDMEYFLTDRLSRHSYTAMFPVLKTAIRLKKAEEVAEQPFRLLLTGQMMAKFNLSREAATDAGDELVTWWKYKTKEHRAIAKDSGKALSMILREYRVRQVRDAARRKMNHAPVVAALLAARPNALYVGHREGKEYVSFSPHNADDVFVREETWRVVDAETVTCESERAWVGIDARVTRWLELYATPRYHAWNKKLNVRKYLTDDEKTQGVRTVLLSAREARADRSASRGLTPVQRVLAVTEDANRLCAWVQLESPVFSNRFLTEQQPRWELTLVQAAYERGAEKIEWTTDSRTHYTYDALVSDPDNNGGADTTPKFLWEDPAEMEAYRADVARTAAFLEETRRLDKIASDYARQLDAEVEKQFLARKKKQYLQEHGDEELWALELSMDKKHYATPSCHFIRSAIEATVEKGEGKIVGMTVAEVIDAAGVRFAKMRKEDESREPELTAYLACVPRNFLFQKLTKPDEEN